MAADMLVEMLIQAARNRGQVEAVTDQSRGLTYTRLLRLARVMRDLVAATTDRLRCGIMLPASVPFPACLFGALWANRTAVPLNFLLAPAELAEIVSRAELDLIITTRHFETLADQLPARAVYLEDLPLKRKLAVATVRRMPAVPAVAPDETAVLLFTSGTAAAPKGVELTYHNLQSNCTDCIATAHMTPDHRFLNCLPPFHVFGLTANVLAPVALGASVFCVPRFSPAAVIDAIRRQRISIMMAIPSMYGAILRSKSAPAELMNDVYLAVSGGEPLSETLRRGFEDRFGTRLLQGYGLSETSPVCTLELPWAKKDGSIGRAVRNVSVRIADNENKPCPTGTDGEIQVKGPNVMKGYYRDPDATTEVMTEDGWFRTGDGGRMDAEGFVTITGRLREMMIVGGENVFPREIEAVLEKHPAVDSVAVIGVPDASRGEVPTAFVIPREGSEVTENELRSFAREHLAGYKVPRQVHLADELPRGPTGKILKRKLSEWA